MGSLKQDGEVGRRWGTETSLHLGICPLLGGSRWKRYSHLDGAELLFWEKRRVIVHFSE
jgi:hypothetical protein